MPRAQEQKLKSSAVKESVTAHDGTLAVEREHASRYGTLQGWAYEEDVGGGAFYGPKIDIKIRDAIGRKWQCSTVQASLPLKSL